MAGKKIPTKIRCSADSEAIITTRVGSFELQDKAALTDRYCNYSYRGSFFFTVVRYTESGISHPFQ